VTRTDSIIVDRVKGKPVKIDEDYGVFTLAKIPAENTVDGILQRITYVIFSHFHLLVLNISNTHRLNINLLNVDKYRLNH
jgi:hypothetical protein